MERMAQRRIILFGTGGVGSWCAEALVRTGFRILTIVDADCVSVTNINRQLIATTETVGQPKVEVLRQRLLQISPSTAVTAIQQTFCEDTADSFHLQSYDYIIDAIDSLRDKALLIRRATETSARFFSSMGAALKLDPTRIRVTDFWRVQGDPLARALRKRFKRDGLYPKRKFLCVYSDELLTNKWESTENPADSNKAQINGTVAHVTAIFGFMLAGLVVKDALAGK